MATAPPDPIICPNCRVGNPPGARFCANCGTPLPGAQQAGYAPPPAPGYPAPPPPPGAGYYPPAPPPAPPIPGTVRAVSVPLPPQAAYDRAIQAVQALGGTIRTVQPPSGFQFQRFYKDTWSTFGIKVSYLSQVQVTPDAMGGSTVGVEATLDSGTALPIIAASIGAGLALAFVGFGLFGILLGGASAAVSWWQLSGTVRGQQADEVLAAVQAGR